MRARIVTFCDTSLLVADSRPLSPLTKGSFIGPDKDPADMVRFAARGSQNQDVLQSVKDALLQAGYEVFVVVTEHSAFRWIHAPES